jgi:hypothetical protein
MDERDMAEVWIVRGTTDRDLDPLIVFEHAFPTRDEAMNIQRRGELELPNIWWTLDRMNYGQYKYADYMFDILKKEA